MSKIESAGMLQSGITDTLDGYDRAETGRTSDGRTWNPVSGAWGASGTKLTSSTARASDPKIVVTEPYADFSLQLDLGLGDSVYFRYQDASNWIRVSQFQTYSSEVVNAGYTVACNPYTAYYVDAPYYACNEYLSYYYQVCNNNYSSGTTTQSGVQCGGTGSNYGMGYYLSCSDCESCCYAGSCQSGFYQEYSNCHYTGGGCTRYTGQYCYDQPVYAWQQCGTTYPYTAYNQCPAYTTNHYYDTYLRLEKYVGGVLTTVRDVQLGRTQANKVTWVRVQGTGTNIQVFSDKSPTTAHINETVSELRFGRAYGAGRVGFGNQDASAIDNMALRIL